MSEREHKLEPEDGITDTEDQSVNQSIRLLKLVPSDKINLRPLLQENVDLNDPEKLSKAIQNHPHSKEDLKETQENIEIAALSSLFIAAMWNKAAAWTKKYYPGFSSYYPHANTYDSSSPENFFISDINVKPLIAQQPNFQKATDQLDNYTSAIYTKALVETLSEIGRQEQHPLHKAKKRYEQLLRNTGAMKIPDTARDSFMHIQAGISTARETIWDTLAVIPYTYYVQHKTVINQNKLTEIAKNSKKIVLTLASIDLKTFSKLHTLGRGVNTTSCDINPSFFYIKQSPQGKSLEFNPNVIDLADRYKESIPWPYTTGCPALHARGSNNQSVVSEMYDWNSKLFIDYAVPLVDNYNANIINELERY